MTKDLPEPIRAPSTGKALQKWPTEADRESLLAAIRGTGSVTAASRTLAARRGIRNRNKVVDKWRRFIARNPDFASDVAMALAEAMGELEATIYKRALSGTEKGVYYQGNLMNTEIVYDNSLALNVLRKLETGSWVATQKSVSTQTVKHEVSVDVNKLSYEDREALKRVLENGVTDAELLPPGNPDDDD